jgi:hypothetical protein
MRSIVACAKAERGFIRFAIYLKRTQADVSCAARIIGHSGDAAASLISAASFLCRYCVVGQGNKQNCQDDQEPAANLTRADVATGFC